MGMIRGALVTIIVIFLFASVFLTGAFLTISMSLDYEIIKPEVQTIISEILLEQTESLREIDQVLVDMQLYCQNTNNTIFFYNIEGQSLEIPCEVVDQGSEAVINYTIEDMVEKNYYKEYDCEFRDCFSQGENPLIIFSKHSQDYWYSWFYTTLVISFVLGGLLFFFMQSRNSFPFLVGILLIIVSLLFLGTGKLVSLIVGWEFAQIFSAFFTQAYSAFLIYIVLGFILIGIGILLKFLFIGRFLGKLFKKDEKISKADIKEVVKEEIREDSKKSKKKK